MKTRTIAVAGKGGTGKTTLAALIINCLKERGEGPILAIDADPDANLGTLLGVEVETAVGDLREDVIKELKDLPPGMSKAHYVEAGLHQIIEESNGFDLITMGRGEGPGCYCYLNNLIRKFYQDLTPSYAWVVMDNEAGLEHISRRTASNLDALLVVVNHNPISIKTAKKIESITQTLKNQIDHKFFVTNMVPPEHKQALDSRLDALTFQHIGDIPYDAALAGNVLDGEPLSHLTDSKAKQIVNEILFNPGGVYATTGCQ